MTGAKRSRALIRSVLLGVLALAGAAAALVVEDRATLIALALSACVAFASLVAALISFGDRRVGASLGALAASLLILGGIGAGFGTVSVRRFVDAVERQERQSAHVDHDLRFSLTPPTRDTIVYSRRALRDVNERAAAGMWIPDGDRSVFVFVEQAYGRSLETAAGEEIAVAIAGEPASFETEQVRFLDREAVRIHRTFEADEDGGRAHEESTFFLHQGAVYGLVAWQTLLETPRESVWFADALDAFALHEGEITLRYIAPRVHADDGPGWRVRDALYENAGHGLRVRGEWLRLGYGDDAARTLPDAVVTLSDRHPDRTLAIVPLRTGGRDLAAVLEERAAGVADWTEADHAPPIEREVAGVRVIFAARVAHPNRTWYYRHGLWTDGERVLELMTWGATRAVADEMLDELRRVELLDEPASAGLRRELAAEWHGVGHHWSIRDGAITDWHERLRWRRPTAAWSARVSDVSDTVGNDELLLLDAPSLGLRGRVTAYASDGMPAQPLHDGILADYAVWASEVSASSPQRFGTDAGVVTSRVADGEWAYAVGTVVRGEEVFHVEVWGTVRDFDAHASEATAAVRGLELLGDEPAARFEQNEQLDARMGYALRSAWRGPPTAQWDDLGASVGSLVQFERGEDRVAVLAALRDPTLSTGDEAAFLLAEHFPDLGYFDEGWRQSAGMLGGRPCRIRTRTLPLGVRTLRVHELEANGVLYLLIVEDGGRRSLDDAAALFRLL